MTAATTTAAAAALVLTGVGAASAAEPTTAIPHSQPLWLRQADHLGHASDAKSVSARVYLAPKGGFDALKAAAIAVSTPGTASYGKFLTPSQYAKRYAAPSSTVSAVKSYLRSAGLKVTGVEAHHRYITVSGDVSAAEKAFHASIDTYVKDGKTVVAPTSALKVASGIAGYVTAVTGLDTAPRTMKPAKPTDAPPPAGFRNARPCSIAYGSVLAKYAADFKTPLPKFGGKTLPYAPCGYTGPQFRAAYEGSSALDGAGVTVAITDAYAAPTIAQDAARYADNHGDGSYASGQLTQVTPSKYTNQDACDPSGWFGEETLDVEAVHAMAPSAKIRYYGAKSCFDQDLLDTLAKVVSENKAKIVTNSWGDVEQAESADSVAAYEQVFLQGALQGISFLFSSGDNGDEVANTGIKQADYPASDPYVTAVGGTADAIGADGTFTFQTGWGTHTYSLSKDGKSWVSGGYLYGAGGGFSALFNKPAYQNGVVAGGSRGVPDVGLDADPQTGMLIGETQTFSDGVYYDEFRIGGTSLASPLFAGMTALSVQKAKHGVGLLNPTIYSTRSTAFRDVKGAPKDAGVVRVNYVNSENADDGLAYIVRTFNQDSSLGGVTTGWDDVTGVGSPNALWLSAIK
jgi:subtilase family serine protease